MTDLLHATPNGSVHGVRGITSVSSTSRNTSSTECSLARQYGNLGHVSTGKLRTPRRRDKRSLPFEGRAQQPNERHAIVKLKLRLRCDAYGATGVTPA